MSFQFFNRGTFMKKIAIILTLMLFVMSFAGCSPNTKSESEAKPTATAETNESKSETKELNISAAASLKDCFTEIQTVYTKSHPDIKVLLNFGASGTLQQQIEQGAPVDVFISAGKKQVNALESKDLLLSDSKTNLLTNSVVVVVPKDSAITDIQELSTDKVKKIAHGDPKVVPMGQYAEEVLDYYKLKDKISEKVVYGKDVKEVLAWVETGNVDAGFVFKTDALISDKVKVILEAPSDSHSPATYPMAIIKATKEEASAKEFVEFLKSDESKVIFEKYGFGQANN